MLNTVFCPEVHKQSQQSFKTIHFSRTKSLNLAGIRIVRFGLLRGSVVSEVPTGRGETTGLAGVSAPTESSGFSGVLKGLTNELFLRCTTPSADFKVSSCPSFV